MKNRGITLIALVITIVVLIILAAVAINLSLGNNGIFNRAKTAKEQYQNAQTDEQKQINTIDSTIDIASSREDIASLQAEINALRSQINSTSVGVPQGSIISGYTKEDWHVEKQGNRVFISGSVTGTFAKNTWTKVITDLPKPANANICFTTSSSYMYGQGYVNSNGELYLISTGGSINCYMNFSYVTSE